MPRDPRSRQKFGLTGDESGWDSTSSHPDAGKVYVVGGELDGLDFGGPVSGSGTALVLGATFSLTGTAWQTVVAAVGAATRVEWRYVQMGNVATKPCIVEWRWNTGAAIMFQPLAGGGGAFNANFIGNYDRGDDNEPLQARLKPAVTGTTSAGRVYGSVKYREV